MDMRRRDKCCDVLQAVGFIALKVERQVVYPTFPEKGAITEDWGLYVEWQRRDVTDGEGKPSKGVMVWTCEGVIDILEMWANTLDDVKACEDE